MKSKLKYQLLYKLKFLLAYMAYYWFYLFFVVFIIFILFQKRAKK